MIGILDSGLAGLDLVRRLWASAPGLPLVYFGDTACGPYDEMSPEAIARHALRGARFLLAQGVRRIALACHATSAAVMGEISAALPVPVLGAAEAAVAAAVRVSPGRRIGIAGARAALRDGAYPDLVRAAAPDTAVYTSPCPLVGPLVMAGWLKKPETTMIVKKCLLPLKVRRIDTLILGDARYPLLAKTFQRKIGRRVLLVDGAAALADRILEDPPAPGPPSAFYLSDITPETDRSAALFLRRRASFVRVTP